jgi:hypothetical protein
MMKIKINTHAENKIKFEKYCAYIGAYKLKIKEKGKRKIKQKAPCLSSLVPVVDTGNLDYCTLAHNRIARLL